MVPCGTGWRFPTRSLSEALSLPVAASGGPAAVAVFIGGVPMAAGIAATLMMVSGDLSSMAGWSCSPPTSAAYLAVVTACSLEPALAAGGASRLRAFPGARSESGLAEESSASPFIRGLLTLDLANGRDAAEPAVGFRLIGFAQLSDASLLLRS